MGLLMQHNAIWTFLDNHTIKILFYIVCTQTAQPAIIIFVLTIWFSQYCIIERLIGNEGKKCNFKCQYHFHTFIWKRLKFETRQNSNQSRNIFETPHSIDSKMCWRTDFQEYWKASKLLNYWTVWLLEFHTWKVRNNSTQEIL